jgi:mitotic spindle assembly checkpoint protein MAD2B
MSEITGPHAASDYLSAFHEFFIVATHLILYLREVYPEAAFERVRHYGIQTYQCRHPKVLAWIENMVSTAMERIQDGVVRKISVVIVSSGNVTLERFAFDVSRFAVSTAHSDDATATGISYGQVADEFRACLSTLVAQAGTFGSLPENSTFTILMETRNKPHLEFDSPWIVADSSKYHTRASHALTVRPVRFVNAGPISFNLILEQDRSKSKLSEIRSSDTDYISMQ